MFPTIEGCNISGVYGSSCDIPCPVNCRNNTCHILNGECFGCRSGWTGSACNTSRLMHNLFMNCRIVIYKCNKTMHIVSFYFEQHVQGVGTVWTVRNSVLDFVWTRLPVITWLVSVMPVVGMGCTANIVTRRVLDTVFIMLHVTGKLVCVKEVVLLDGMVLTVIRVRYSVYRIRDFYIDFQ